jgi:arginine decarboxylase
MKKRVEIDIVWGAGQGNTTISAFDAALADAGIADFNLILLSSVIPPDAEVKKIGRFSGKGVGMVLPVVLARSSGTGHQVAGLGWTTSPQGGLLFESCGRTRQEIEEDIEKGLTDMMNRRSWKFSSISSKIREADYNMSCALVAAVFLIPRPRFLEWFWMSQSGPEVHHGD